MRQLRQFLLILGSVVGTWILGSFAGAMLNPANAAFWSGSLMWSLLAGLLIAPALLVINHASRTAPVAPRDTSAQEPFVDEKDRRTLWPEGSQTTAEAASETAAASERVGPASGEDEWPYTRAEALA